MPASDEPEFNLEQALELLFGQHWPTEAPKVLCVNRTTLYRQVSGQSPINGLLVVAVRALLEVEHIKATRRAYQRSWRRGKGGTGRD